MRLHRLAFRAMASPCDVQVFGDDEVAAQLALASAEAEVRRIEHKYSRYRDDSVVGRINASAGRAAIAIDAETAALLDFAEACHRDSGGLFDPTAGVLRRAWDFRRPAPPDQAAIDGLLPLIGWSGVEREGNSVRLAREGMELDLGGFGKEYAADRAAAILIESGHPCGFVNLGGDVRLLGGARPDGRAWRIGIQHPRALDRVAAQIYLRDGALATSGDYERFIEIAGRRWCHVLDPRTGWPVEDAPRSVTVCAPTCTEAGMLTTMALLRGAGARLFLRDAHVRCWIQD